MMKKVKLFEQFVNENNATKEDFDSVVKALKGLKSSVTVIFIPKWNEIEILTGDDRDNRIVDEVIKALDKAKIQTGIKSGISVAADSSSYSRREYEAIEKINGGH
jgi:hypothetical protein